MVVVAVLRGEDEGVELRECAVDEVLVCVLIIGAVLILLPLLLLVVAAAGLVVVVVVAVLRGEDEGVELRECVVEEVMAV